MSLIFCELFFSTLNTRTIAWGKNSIIHHHNSSCSYVNNLRVTDTDIFIIITHHHLKTDDDTYTRPTIDAHCNNSLLLVKY
jgi:hypothetical protein